jgi:DNA-directed RNA polymerase beta' subunit
MSATTDNQICLERKAERKAERKVERKVEKKVVKKVSMKKENILRNLTTDEIEYILDFIKPKMGIPIETAISLMEIHKEKLRKQLLTQKLYSLYIKEDIEELKSEIKRYYFTSMIEAGESIGVIAAQSIGEKNTQNTLNTFHKAGMTEKSVVAGVPRFEELLNATENPKGICCTVYFKRGTESIQSLRKVIGHSIVELTFKTLATEMKVVMNKKPEKWYKSYAALYGDEFMEYKHCISITVDMRILYEYSLTLRKIATILESIHSEIHCVCSSSSIGRIDIFVDTECVVIDDNILYVTEENKEEIFLDEVVKPKLRQIVICGIQGIKAIYYLKKDGEWLIETDGSNYRKLLSHPDVDETRTVSNDIWDMYSVLGIETTKYALFQEFELLMSGINHCHIKLLVDKMTYTGRICSISRYAMKKEEAGPMSKASFEESVVNFTNAAVYGEKESTRGVSASIICGKRAKIGTGICNLMIDINVLINCGKEKALKKKVSFVDSTEKEKETEEQEIISISSLIMANQRRKSLKKSKEKE